MKQRFYYFVMTIFLSLLLIPGGLEAQESKTAYGIILSEQGQANQRIGVVSFDLNNPEKLTLLHPLEVEGITTGAYLDGKFYYYECKLEINGYFSIGFNSVDMEDGTVQNIVDYGGGESVVAFSHMVYDYSSSTMYALDGNEGGYGLCTVDLETGMTKEVCTFDVEDKSYFGGYFTYLGCNYDGDMYGITFKGNLYKINKVSGECTKIATLDYLPDKAYMYTNSSLTFDEDTKTWYIRVRTSENGYELRTLDITNGKTEHVGYFENNANVDAIYIPYQVAEASAPAKVNNLTITPGADGALNATIEWDNPEKTYGRGGTLESLTSVTVYRNGEKVHTIDNPVIGGHEVYTDNVPASDIYTYRVVPANEMGDGDRTSVTSFVGRGIPLPVENLTLKEENHAGRISWTAPVKGKYDSWIDKSTLTYDIVRYPDSIPVAQNVKDTTYLDNSMTEVGNVYYTVQPKTIDGVGEIMQTENVTIGPAIQVPYSFKFDTQNQFDIWTVIDANLNNSTWQWTGMYSSLKGASCRYAYDEIAANDWLISPSIALKAGQHYQISFDAMPGNKNVQEDFTIMFGQGTGTEQLDSVDHFTIKSPNIVKLRTNLPVVKEDGEYNFGFLYRSYYNNYGLTIGNISISEDHEGYIEGKVTAAGKAIANARVATEDGLFEGYTDENGKYKLSYLPEGTHSLIITALGYNDTYTEAEVTELQTTTKDIEMTERNKYSVSGKVIDVAGDAVTGAAITINGYNEYLGTTDDGGNFTINDIYQSELYNITITKNKLISYNSELKVNDNVDLGNITLEDNIKAPVKVQATLDDNGNMSVTWDAPVNDPIEYRYDDGTVVNSLGISSGTNKSVFGAIHRRPSSVTGFKWYVCSNATTTHYSVQVYVLDLDENGEPTSNVLYYNSYVPNTDDQWNSYTFPTPVEAPRGFMIAISCYGFIGIAIDGDGDKDMYPFVEHANCYASDYTTGEFAYLEDAGYAANFLIRPVASPYEMEEAPSFVRQQNTEKAVEKHDIEIEAADNIIRPYVTEETCMPMKTVEDRVRYNVYRYRTIDEGNEEAYTTMAEGLKDRVYTDTSWNELEQGVYKYGVKALYTGDYLSATAPSDSIAKDMLTTVVFTLNTNTPTNESDGAVAHLTSSDGLHSYSATADAQGKIEINDVWKAQYGMTITLDGFDGISENLDLSKEASYEFSYKLNETQIQPFNLTIYDEGENDERLLVWNFPDLIYDGFEEHDDFMIASPGKIGWQYIDGDGLETGGLTYNTWPNIFQPMSFIVFNPSATEPSLENDYALKAVFGKKYIASFAAYPGPNDDWFISPRLYFTEDFKFNFYAKSMQTYSQYESIEVGYSTTGIDEDDFIMVADSFDVSGYWTEYSYDIPKEAKYVAIHHISNAKYVLMVDEVRIGLPEAINPQQAEGRKAVRQNMPSPSGAYEIYLDGEKVADTDETTYTFTGLTNGEHTAGVRASYTSGITDISTVNFQVTGVGIEDNSVSSVRIYKNGDRLYIEGDYENPRMFSASGYEVKLDAESEGCYDISNLNAGVYIISLISGDKTVSEKIVIE